MGMRAMMQAMAAAVFFGAAMLCGSAAAQVETICIPPHAGIAPPINLPAIPRWHETAIGTLIPDGTQDRNIEMGGRVVTAASGQTAAQAAEESLKNWGVPVQDACGREYPPARALLREKLADVSGLQGRRFAVIAMTDTVSGWRDVFAFVRERNEMLRFRISGDKADVEKHYPAFTGMLQRYGTVPR